MTQEGIQSMGKYLEAKQKKWFWLLLLALIGYTLKNILVGADVDEGYGIMAGYRLAQGDRLLLEMWEPHQTSAIFTALLIKPFVWITGGVNGLNIYLRVMFFVLHGFVSYQVYRTLIRCVPEVGNVTAGMMAIFFYVSSPKCIYIPEYSNLQVWFTTALILCLLWCYDEKTSGKGRAGLLIWGGVLLACDVLAYPSMVLLFPVCLGYILWKSGSLRDAVLFALPCVAGALLFVGYILSYMSVEQIGRVLPHILGDGSHQVVWSQKLSGWLADVGTAFLFLTVGAILAAVCTCLHVRLEGKKGRANAPVPLFLFWFVILQAAFQMVYWCVGKDAVVCPQMNYLFVPLFGVYCFYRNRRKDSAGILMILLAFGGYLAVALLSNWGLSSLHVYLPIAVLGGLVCWNTFFVEKLGAQGRRLLRRLLFMIILCNVFGYSYRMIGGDTMSSNILEVRGLNHSGVRAGILTNYMTAHRYNVNLESWEEMIPDGSTLLYVGASQFSYMMGDYTIAMPNTISTPSYDENLLAYWELNPERYPDIVAVESMYGEITVVEQDGFLMKWLEEEFKASEIIEYPYITVYKK